MNDSEKEALAYGTAQMRRKMDRVFGDSRILGDARFADAVHDVFLSEVREQGWNVAEPAWASLDAAAIRKIGKELERLVSPRAGAAYTLPAGTVAIAPVTGCVAIGWDTLCIDRDRPGLNDIFDMPHRPGGSNLAHLLQYVDELSRDQPFRAMGMPSLVDRFNGGHPDDLFQFPPLASVAEVILQREMDFTLWCEFFCAFSDDTIRNLAEDIIDDMRLMWVNAEHYAPSIEALRDAANRVVRNLREVEIRAVTIDISNQRSGGDRYVIEFDAWDDAFRRGLVVQEVETRRELESSLVESKFDASAFDVAVLDRAGKVERYLQRTETGTGSKSATKY
jgi:hypothetical protein